MRHIASSASSKNMGSRAHFNTMCFLFAGKIMAADANQLQDLRKFLRLEMKIQPELRSIENLNPSSVVNDENVDLATRNVM